MTINAIEPFDEFYCASHHDTNLAFTVSETYKAYGHKTCVKSKSIHKFGENDSVANVESPIHPWGEFETYQTNNVALNMSSSDNSDTATVTIEYMSFNFAGEFVFATQTKTLTGQTPVTLSDSGCRWMRMYTDDDHAGDIYLYRDGATNGVPSDLAKTHNMILAGTSQSQKASTSVAANSYFFLTHIWADIIRKGSVSASINLKTTKLGGSARNKLRRGISDGHSLEYEFTPLFIVEPNTDIELTAQTDSNSPTDVTAGFNGYFADIISS